MPLTQAQLQKIQQLSAALARPLRIIDALQAGINPITGNALTDTEISNIYTILKSDLSNFATLLP